MIGRMSNQDAVALTRSLFRSEPVNPPGRERDCARHVGAMLEESGFSIQYFEHAESRTSVVARAGGNDAQPPLCLTGHIDVVALGSRKWTKDPFSGETEADRLSERATSDMKPGIAVILLSPKNLSNNTPSPP